MGLCTPRSYSRLSNGQWGFMAAPYCWSGKRSSTYICIASVFCFYLSRSYVPFSFSSLSFFSTFYRLSTGLASRLPRYISSSTVESPGSTDLLWIDLFIVQNGRSCLGDSIYRAIASEHFSPDWLLSELDFTDEHNILDVANRLETAVLVWRRRGPTKNIQLSPNDTKFNPKTSWGRMKDLVSDMERRELFALRAESLLVQLKQRVPGMAQTLLDTNKIQFNRVSCIRTLLICMFVLAASTQVRRLECCIRRNDIVLCGSPRSSFEEGY